MPVIVGQRPNYPAHFARNSASEEAVLLVLEAVVVFTAGVLVGWLAATWR